MKLSNMKNVILLFMLASITTVFSQIPERLLLKGKINVPQNAEASNINIYNKNTLKGTTTNSIGEFLIEVKEGDHIILSSIQFQDFEIEISKEMMKERDIVIRINENVNQLNEVTVSSSRLSGDLRVDIRKIGVEDSGLNMDEDEVINTYDANLTTGTQIRAENIGIQEEYLQNGMDFVKIFKNYIQKPKDKKAKELDDLDVEVRKMYDNDFFKEYLNVEPENINEFIYYAETHGLTEKMLKKGNEMELIQFLVDVSEQFENEKN